MDTAIIVCCSECKLTVKVRNEDVSRLIAVCATSFGIIEVARRVDEVIDREYSVKVNLQLLGQLRGSNQLELLELNGTQICKFIQAKVKFKLDVNLIHDLVNQVVQTVQAWHLLDLVVLHECIRQRLDGGGSDTILREDTVSLVVGILPVSLHGVCGQVDVLGSLDEVGTQSEDTALGALLQNGLGILS